jgi:hypothetical protein
MKIKQEFQTNITTYLRIERLFLYTVNNFVPATAYPTWNGKTLRNKQITTTQ